MRVTGVALCALLLLSAAADAQRQPAGGGPRNAIPSGGGQAGDASPRDRGERGGRGDKRFRGDVFLIENEVVEVVEKEVPAAAGAPAAPAAAPAAAPEEKREPYKVGNSYDTLPPGCMKMIQDGASYYFCGGGEWYQRVGGQYKAVEQP